MRHEFMHYLEKEGVVPSDRPVPTDRGMRKPTEPIGSIAFCHGMLTGADVDQILERQKESRRPFGEIAVEMGILDDWQLDRLLEVQRLRLAFETAEQLILSGACPMADVVNRLGQFLVDTYGRAPAEPRSV